MIAADDLIIQGRTKKRNSKKRPYIRLRYAAFYSGFF